MEVPFSADEQTRINHLAATTGQGAGQFVREVVAGYLEELDEVRQILNSRGFVAKFSSPSS
jgi:predicted DNA-binding protein